MLGIVLPRVREEPRVLLRYAEESGSSAPAATASASDAKDAIAGEYPLPSQRIKVSVGGEIYDMDLEEYLVGVVAAEMPASSEPAALMAQAVAARTFAALHMEGRAVCSHGQEGCDVCGDPYCCQAYLTEAELRSAWGDGYEKYAERIRSAVRSTEGIVVVYEGKLISALYHASAGPATENSEAVFAVALPYLVSVSSNEGDSQARSLQEFTQEELCAKLNALFPDAHLAPPLSQSDIDVWGRTESGRVQLVQIGETVITGQQLRSALGLKSTEFTVTVTDTSVRFECVGYGHGVGMSQRGANEMAKQGSSYEEILLHYYTGTELARLVYG